ncbi:MAG: ferric reductase-like transmembrane domain-containing protein [Parachlamydiales bacterium]
MRRTLTVCLVLAGLFILAYLFASWDAWEGVGRHHGRATGPYIHSLKGWGTLFGVAGLTTFSLTLALASRWPKLEDWLGGLDQLYRTHHTLGIITFCLLIAHPFLLALRHTNWAAFFLPTHDRLSVNLGAIAFWSLVLLIGLSLIRFLPYDKWKWTHRFMGLIFLIASLHVLLTQKAFAPSASPLLYLPIALGLLSLAYRQVWIPLFRKRPRFTVTQLTPLTDTTTEITLTSDHPFPYKPGQYAFFQFDKPTRESHPFTLRGTPGEKKLSILVKGRGDYTRRLLKTLKPGDTARLEGPYGRFDYTQYPGEQVWIAGGIGIVPFLTWAPSLSSKAPKITLYYCVKNSADAAGLKEIKNITTYLICSSERPHLKATELPYKGASAILLCGPRRLTRDLTHQLTALGYPRRQIHFEDFEFFSSYGR